MTVLERSIIETRALGTELRIDGLGAAQALAEVQRLEAVLSRFKPSPLTTLNEQGELQMPPRELYEALRYALKVAQDTGGLITPAVRGALVAAGYGAYLGSPSGQQPFPACRT